MSYVNFDYYKNIFLGTFITDENIFNRLALRAAEFIDYQTMGKAVFYFMENPEPIEKCVCALAEVMRESENGNAANSQSGNGRGGIIKSESAGDESYTYQIFDSMSESGQKNISDRIQKILEYYLIPTNLLYRGASLC